MDAQQLADATQNTTVEYDVSIRQVGNGFVLAGTVRYLDKDTKVLRVNQNFEAVATEANAAVETARNFLVGGAFDADVN
jgi:hypothetical protein